VLDYRFLADFQALTFFFILSASLLFFSSALPSFPNAPPPATLLRGGNYFSGRCRKNQFPRSALPSSPHPRRRRPCCAEEIIFPVVAGKTNFPAPHFLRHPSPRRLFPTALRQRPCCAVKLFFRAVPEKPISPLRSSFVTPHPAAFSQHPGSAPDIEREM